MKKFAVMLLVLTLVCPWLPNAAAEAFLLPVSESEGAQKTKEAGLSWRIVEEEEAEALKQEPGLYLIWHNAPENLYSVTVRHSVGGLDYSWQEQCWSDEEWSDQGIPELTEEGDLVLLCCRPDEAPLSSYLSQAVNSIYFKMSYMLDSWEEGELPPVRVSHDLPVTVPETPPSFSAELKWVESAYSVVGHFREFTPGIARMRCAYSWDGVTWQYSNPDFPGHWDIESMGDESARECLENQEVFLYYEEPLASFLAGVKDSFYLRLEITAEKGVEDGEVRYFDPYYSDSVLISRNPQPELLPDGLTPRAAFGFDLSVSETVETDNGGDGAEPVTYTRGQYRMTVCENAAAEEIIALLPDTVPVRVRFWDIRTKEKYAFGDVSCPVTWKVEELKAKLTEAPLKAGEMLVLEDMAKPLAVPAGTCVETALGTYILREPLAFTTFYDSGDIALVLHPVKAGAVPQAALREYRFEETSEDVGDPLSLAFWNKPSGAVSIRAYARLDDTRWDLGELLERRRVDHNQSHALYGYLELLEPYEEPYSSWLAGEIDGFSIGLEIVGGVFDGQRLELPWPQDYEYPQEVFDPFDNEGQENNAGNGYEEVEGDNNGGLREWLTSVEEEQAPAGWTPPHTVCPAEVESSSSDTDGGDSSQTITPEENGSAVQPPTAETDAGTEEYSGGNNPAAAGHETAKPDSSASGNKPSGAEENAVGRETSGSKESAGQEAFAGETESAGVSGSPEGQREPFPQSPEQNGASQTEASLPQEKRAVLPIWGIVGISVSYTHLTLPTTERV